MDAVWLGLAVALFAMTCGMVVVFERLRAPTAKARRAGTPQRGYA